MAVRSRIVINFFQWKLRMKFYGLSVLLMVTPDPCQTHSRFSDWIERSYCTPALLSIPCTLAPARAYSDVSWSFSTDHSLSGLMLDPILSLSGEGETTLSESILSLSGEATHLLHSGSVYLNIKRCHGLNRGPIIASPGSYRILIQSLSGELEMMLKWVDPVALRRSNSLLALRTLPLRVGS